MSVSEGSFTSIIQNFGVVPIPGEGPSSLNTTRGRESGPQQLGENLQIDRCLALQCCAWLVGVEICQPVVFYGPSETRGTGMVTSSYPRTLQA